MSEQSWGGERERSGGLDVLAGLHGRLFELRGWRAFLVSVGLGMLACLAFAPVHLVLVLLVSYGGLVWLIDGARARERWLWPVFARGWAFGAGFCLVSMHWTAEPFLVDIARHGLLLWIPLVVLPAGLGLLWGLGAVLAGVFWSASPSRVFIAAAAFSIAEYARGQLFGGFPWNAAGTGWPAGSAVSQLASLGGVYFVTALTLLLACAPAALVDSRRAGGLGLRSFPVFFATVVFTASWAWGAQRLASGAPDGAEVDARTVTLMDAGLPQAEKTSLNALRILRRYLEILDQAPGEPGDIVIWPEGAVPAARWSEAFPASGFLQNPQLLDTVSAVLGPRTLVAGTTHREDVRGGTVNWYNALTVIDRSQSAEIPVALYKKHRLVPLGELALADILPFGGALTSVLPGTLHEMARAGFRPGPGPRILITGEAAPDFIPMICYEALYPGVPRDAVRSLPVRPRWMVVVSNDAWFGGGIGPAQHAAQNRYRAIETGLPLARVATLGETAMYDGFGRMTARGAPVAGDPQGWRSAVVRAPLPPALNETLYLRLGALPFWTLIAAFCALGFASWRR